jgi:mannose/cellobiose epimerase-like protein (N-acyl-D-glucosamine 2-epimerase family)
LAQGAKVAVPALINRTHRQYNHVFDRLAIASAAMSISPSALLSETIKRNWLSMNTQIQIRQN